MTLQAEIHRLLDTGVFTPSEIEDLVADALSKYNNKSAAVAQAVEQAIDALRIPPEVVAPEIVLSFINKFMIHMKTAHWKGWSELYHNVERARHKLAEADDNEDEANRTLMPNDGI